MLLLRRPVGSVVLALVLFARGAAGQGEPSAAAASSAPVTDVPPPALPTATAPAAGATTAAQAAPSAPAASAAPSQPPYGGPPGAGAPGGPQPFAAYGPYPGYAAATDRGAPPPPERGAPQAIVEAGGLLGQGLDATDTATREGGLYLGARYFLAPEVLLLGRYAFSTGDEVVRAPGSSRFGVANDLTQTSARHAIDLALGYRQLLTQGAVSPFVLPSIGPRVLVLARDASPMTALELSLGGRAGLTTRSAEVSAFIAWAPAIVATKEPLDVYGTVRSELRFGADVAVAIDNPLSVTLGYEGDVLELEHERVTRHRLLAGITYSF